METIKSYLEAMFASMPNTPEVKKAKAELLQMMEDKYNELIADGVSENTAVGTVISEFGNLDELAEDLGLEKEVEEVHERDQEEKRRFVSLSEVTEYLESKVISARRVALGVLLCIISVTPPIIWDYFSNAHADLGAVGMFVLIAIAVGLFVLNGFSTKDWEYLKKEKCKIDMQTAEYVRNQQESFKKTSILCHTLGIVLCILSVTPCIIIDNDLMASCIFGFVGIGVFLIMYASIINGSFEDILKINDARTISGEYGRRGDKRVRNRGLNTALWIVLIVLLVLWLCRHLLWFIPFNGKSVSDTVTFDNESVSEVSIDVDASDLTVKYGNTLSVNYTYPENYVPTITLKNGKLDITENNNMTAGFFEKKSYKMVVTIPKGTKLDEMNLNADAGDVKIADIQVSKMIVDADCGDIDISGINANTSKFIIDVGDFDIEDSFVGDSEITCSVGDVDGEIEFDSLDISCDVGDVEITTNSDLNNLTTDCDLGSIRINGNKR